ncbi:metallophosphoesterase [Zunongwangia endophytica]|uniref:Metallophosphoesterase n=1 Tax=Zunongwangia endophytica TaxID=1808945 RepID=A0ABV8HC37_9FLAO|nr:metallophosphoesterase [Zunongwangia endophytica]MDN3594155.1 metallophosphoesterase [Zunongwangia endophytica]
MNRKNFLKNLAIISGLAAIPSFYAWKVEPFWLEFVHQKMPVKNLPSALRGKTLMQISDIHIGDFFDYQYIIDSFNEAQQLKPDFVVYTGDFVTYNEPKNLEQLAEVIPYFPTGSLGSLGILGNHDYGIDYEEEHVAKNIIDQLASRNIQILRNEALNLNGINFIGIDDFWGSNFHPEKATLKYNPEIANITLCHNPDVCDLDVWNDYKGWILSGHTHGGQCKPPFLKAPILPVENKRYDAGVIDLYDGRMLYINRALGCLRQIRFNVRPEITVFELESV